MDFNIFYLTSLVIHSQKAFWNNLISQGWKQKSTHKFVKNQFFQGYGVASILTHSWLEWNLVHLSNTLVCQLVHGLKQIKPFDSAILILWTNQKDVIKDSENINIFIYKDILYNFFLPLNFKILYNF